MNSFTEKARSAVKDVLLPFRAEGANYFDVLAGAVAGVADISTGMLSPNPSEEQIQDHLKELSKGMEVALRQGLSIRDGR